MEQEDLVYTEEGEEIPQGSCLADLPASSCGEPAEEGEKEEEEESHSDDVSTANYPVFADGLER